MRFTHALALLALALPWPQRAAAPPAPCSAWIGLHDGVTDRVLCGAEAAAALKALSKAPQITARWGDHLRLRGGEVRRGRLSAGLRLRLGLRLDVNEAPAEALRQVRGIGPWAAARIVAARPFERLDDLLRVKGIGPKRLAEWRAALRIEPAPPLKTTPRSARDGDPGEEIADIAGALRVGLAATREAHAVP